MKIQDINAEEITRIARSAASSLLKMSDAARTFSIAAHQMGVTVQDLVEAHSQQSQKRDTLTPSATDQKEVTN